MERPLVLLADDDPDILALVAFRLERAGYDVIRAADGDEALRLVNEHGPSLAILDVMMPKLSGYDVTQRIRANVATRRIPVILLTARVQEADERRGADVGADDYLKKPLSAPDLRARVEAVLARR